MLKKQNLISAEMIIRKVRDNLRERGCTISELSEQFRFLVIEESENYYLNIHQVKWLADKLNIPYEKIPEQYSAWIPGFSNYLTCIKYTNPSDPREYILQAQARNKLGSLELLHRDPSNPKVFSSVVFQKIIPYFTEDLDALRNNLHQKVKQDHPAIQTYDLDKQGAIIRGAFGEVVCKTVNKSHPSIDPFTIRVIHAFFDIGIPEIDGMCPKCYRVSMPKSGFGIRYKSSLNDGLYYEVRLSSEKLCGYPQQSEIYITNTLNMHGQIRYVKWTESNDNFNLTQMIDEEITHIPYRLKSQQSVFDYLKSQTTMSYFRNILPKIPNIVVPLCQCL